MCTMSTRETILGLPKPCVQRRWQRSGGTCPPFNAPQVYVRPTTFFLVPPYPSPISISKIHPGTYDERRRPHATHQAHGDRLEGRGSGSAGEADEAAGGRGFGRLCEFPSLSCARFVFVLALVWVLSSCSTRVWAACTKGIGVDGLEFFLDV